MKGLVFLIALAFFLVCVPFVKEGNAANYNVMLQTGAFPPYFFSEESSSTGIIKDFLAAISRETGDKFTFMRVPFKRALYQFEHGRIDIEPMCNPVWRISSKVPGVYTIPFAVSEDILLFNAEAYTSVKSPEDLLGKTVGVVQGYYYPTYGPYFVEGQIKPHFLLNEEKLIQLLLAERLDQAIMNRDYALYKIKHSNLQDKLVVGESCSVLDMMMRIHPSKKDAVPRFNKAIKKMIENGTLERIYAKYR